MDEDYRYKIDQLEMRIIEIHERLQRVLSDQIEFNDKQIEFDRSHHNQIQYLEKKIELLEKQIKERK